MRLPRALKEKSRSCCLLEGQDESRSVQIIFKILITLLKPGLYLEILADFCSGPGFAVDLPLEAPGLGCSC